MSHWRHTAQEYERKLKQKKRQAGKEVSLDQLRKHYREVGPIVFCEELKLTVRGRPVTLSDDQKRFLTDVWKGKVRLIAVVAGRGAGKTLVLAVYVAWKIFCFDGTDISAMGGSAEQSEKIQAYITEWERRNDFIRKSIRKNVQRRIQAQSYNEVIFMSCSGQSVRGPHTNILIQDEVCAGEEAGEIKHIRAAEWEVSTSPDIQIIKTSTAQYVFGDFVDIIEDPEHYGYKVYRWSIAKHESGITDPYSIYKYKTGWSPNVPWIKQEAIDILRKNKSDYEWLVEALGGVARRSGAVVNPEDLKIAICKLCDVCVPYSDSCVVKPDILKKITERYLGIDWGRNAPHAFTVVGRLKNKVYILFNEELIGVRDEEALKTAEDLCKLWTIPIVLPDPAQYPFNNQLIERGLTVYQLFTQYGGQEKLRYASNTIRHFERYILFVPQKFEKLIRSVRGLSYDSKGKIRKKNDHSWDSLMYALSEYREDIQKDLWTQRGRFLDLWKK